ncbi:MAG: DUF4160 domain-containing protein [Paracoccus sp. (in: a-proteobacteria)]|nr:DUF4160 domain-containing protein [Paracoccus sp. (in: a-proteobacteria)]
MWHKRGESIAMHVILREPAHIHVRRGRDEARFWLRPEVVPAYNDGFGAKDLNRLARMVIAHRADFERALDECFA